MPTASSPLQRNIWRCLHIPASQISDDRMLPALFRTSGNGFMVFNSLGLHSQADIWRKRSSESARAKAKLRLSKCSRSEDVKESIRVSVETQFLSEYRKGIAAEK